MGKFDFSQEPIPVCLHCGRFQNKHRASDAACPIGSGNFPSWSYKSKFEAKPFSARSLANARRREERIRKEEQDKLEAARLKEIQEETERNMVRALTFEEVIEATKNIIQTETGCEVHISHDRNNTAELTLIGNGLILGWTTVTKTTLNGYLVGGVFSGCFQRMFNSSGKICLHDKLAPLFDTLQEMANKEKSNGR